MKRTFLLLLLMSFVAFVAGAVDRFVPIESPSGMVENPYSKYQNRYRGNAIKVVDDTLYVATTDGIYYLDQGVRDGNFEWRNAAYGGMRVYDFVKGDDGFMAAISTDWKDELISWDRATGEYTTIIEQPFENIYAIACNTADRRYVSVLGWLNEGSGYYLYRQWRSEDGGHTWAEPIYTSGRNRFFINPYDNTTVATILLCDELLTIIFKTEVVIYPWGSDRGPSHSVDGMDTDVVFVPLPSGSRIVICSKSKVFLSDDGGKSLREIDVEEQLGRRPEIIKMAVDPENPSVIYALDVEDLRYAWKPSSDPAQASRDGDEILSRLLTSVDGGETWKCIGEYTQSGADVSGMVVYHGELIVTMGDGSMWKIPMPDAKLDTVDHRTSNMTSTTEGEMIMVANAEPGEVVRVVSPQGLTLASGKTDEKGEAMIRCGVKRGILLVTCAGATVKVSM